MDFFICLPVLFGCKDTITPEGDQIPRFCPRCNNASVGRAKTKRWFELCFVPLIPMSSNHVWHCAICQWQVPSNQAWEPAIANAPQAAGGYFSPPPQQAFMQPPPPGGQWQAGYHYPPPQPGYQPAYPKQ